MNSLTRQHPLAVPPPAPPAGTANSHSSTPSAPADSDADGLTSNFVEPVPSRQDLSQTQTPTPGSSAARIYVDDADDDELFFVPPSPTVPPGSNPTDSDSSSEPASDLEPIEIPKSPQSDADDQTPAVALPDEEILVESTSEASGIADSAFVESDPVDAPSQDSDLSVLSAPAFTTNPSKPVSLTYLHVSEYDRLLAERHKWWIISRVTAVLVVLGALLFLLQSLQVLFTVAVQSIPLVVAVILLAAFSNFAARMAWPTRRRVIDSLRSAGLLIVLAIPATALLAPVLLPPRPTSDFTLCACFLSFAVVLTTCFAFLPRVFQQGPPELRFPE